MKSRWLTHQASELAILGFQTKQLLCVPVANAKGKVIGAIQIMNTHHGMPFGKDTAELVDALKVLHVAVTMPDMYLLALHA